MRRLGALLLALLALPLGAASGSHVLAVAGRDDTCSPIEARVVYDCWLALDLRLTASCPAVGACRIEQDGSVNASDDVVLRTLTTTVRLANGTTASEITTRCTTVTIGRGSCPLFGDVRYTVANGTCASLSVLTTYHAQSIERARYNTTGTLCRSAAGVPSWG